MNVRRISLISVVALGASLGLAACGGDDKSAEEKIAEELTEELTGGAVDVDSGDGTTKISTDEGEMTIDEDGNMTFDGEDGSGSISSSEEVPDDFPSDVPLPEGLTVANGQKFETDGRATWSVGYEPSEDIDVDFCEAYFDEVAAAGFDEDARMTSSDGSYASYSGTEYDVSVSGCGAEVGVIVTVMPTAS